MLIESVSLSLPSWKVTNEEVVDFIKYHSKPVFTGNLEKTLRKISFVLNKTGAKTRYWLNRNKGEKPIDHIVKAVEDVLKKANLEKGDIDLLVYVGVGRGVIEPGDSYFVAKRLGMNKVRCFDVIDACMSWVSTMQIIDSLFKTESYRRAMIINGEFIVHSGAIFKNYALTSEKQLEYTFPSFTVGEAATCTILSPNEPGNFKFHFSSRADLAGLCSIPLPEFEDYCESFDEVANNGSMYFTSYGYQMHQFGSVEVQKLFRTLSINKDEIDVVLTHASSNSEWLKCTNAVGIDDKVYCIYQKTGNLISASVPAAISLAVDEGKLRKNDKILSLVGSAGMSFSAANFTF